MWQATRGPQSALKFVTTAGNTGHSFDRGYTCTEYGLYEKEIIFNLKYKRKTHLAPIIAEIMYDRLETAGIEEYPDIIVPVPMYVTKERKRGFNQAALIAKELARLMGIEYRADVVMRCKSTGVMKRLSPEERLNNVRSAFEVYEGMRRKIFRKKYIYSR